MLDEVDVAHSTRAEQPLNHVTGEDLTVVQWHARSLQTGVGVWRELAPVTTSPRRRRQHLSRISTSFCVVSPAKIHRFRSSPAVSYRVRFPAAPPERSRSGT